VADRNSTGVDFEKIDAQISRSSARLLVLKGIMESINHHPFTYVKSSRDVNPTPPRKCVEIADRIGGTGNVDNRLEAKLTTSSN